MASLRSTVQAGGGSTAAASASTFCAASPSDLHSPAAAQLKAKCRPLSLCAQLCHHLSAHRIDPTATQPLQLLSPLSSSTLVAYAMYVATPSSQ